MTVADVVLPPAQDSLGPVDFPDVLLVGGRVGDQVDALHLRRRVRPRWHTVGMPFEPAEIQNRRSNVRRWAAAWAARERFAALWPAREYEAIAYEELENAEILVSEMLLENVGPVVIATTLAGSDWSSRCQSRTQTFYDGIGTISEFGITLQKYESREAASDGHAAWGDSSERVARAIHRRKVLIELAIASSGVNIDCSTASDFCANDMDLWGFQMTEPQLIRATGNLLRYRATRDFPIRNGSIQPRSQ